MKRESQKGQRIEKAQGIVNPLGKRLYTLKEAAKYLGRSEWGMRELIWDGGIPIVRRAGQGKIYLDILDLEGFIVNNKSVYE